MASPNQGNLEKVRGCAYRWHASLVNAAVQDGAALGYGCPVPIQRFGRYLLEDLLATGGMGEVFLATDTGSVGADPAYRRPCVVKRILPHLVHQPDTVAMFAREAVFGAALNHQNITQVLDHGQVDGRHYLAMEYVKGINLMTLLNSRRERGEQLDIGLAVHIAVQVAMALQHAHEARLMDGTPLQLVHRDVSPQNVLLSIHGEVKLTDFGMVKGAAVPGVFQTQETTLKGKLAYLSPEQASGAPVDSRSDFFALGTLLHECLTLQNPWSDKGETGMALLDRIKRGGAALVRERRPEAPVWLEELVTALLAPMPEDRIQGATQMFARVVEMPLQHRAMAMVAHDVSRLHGGALKTQEAPKPVSVPDAPPLARTQEAAKPARANVPDAPSPPAATMSPNLADLPDDDEDAAIRQGPGPLGMALALMVGAVLLGGAVMLMAGLFSSSGGQATVDAGRTVEVIRRPPAVPKPRPVPKATPSPLGEPPAVLPPPPQEEPAAPADSASPEGR